MATLTSLINEIEANITDKMERADVFLNCAIAQIDINETTNAIKLLNKAALLIQDLYAIEENKDSLDYFISQLAYEYAVAGDKAKAQSAINAIVNNNIKQETYVRITKEIMKTDIPLAITISQNFITDQDVLDDFNGDFALYSISVNNVVDAKTYNNNIVNEDKKRNNYKMMLREYAKQRFT